MEEKTISMGHLMVDIETLGTGANSVICAIGAVEFNIGTGETHAVFYRNIDIQSCLDAGLKVEGKTLKWWLMQSGEAQVATYTHEVPLRQALQDFSDFLSPVSDNIVVWRNGFDTSRLADAFQVCGLPLPWKYYNERDVRTLAAICPSIKDGIAHRGTVHNALDDCLYQIKYCTAIWQYIHKNLVRS